MSDNQHQIPTFDEVMQPDTQNGKIPSFEDIMGVSVKKKEPTTPLLSEAISKNGSQAGQSVFSPLSTVGKGVSKDILPTEIDRNDPAKSLLSPFQQKQQQAAERAAIPVSESTAQTFLTPSKEYQQTLESQNIPSLPRANENLDNATSLVKSALFPTGKNAKDYLTSRIMQNGKIDPDNQTENLALQSKNEYDNLFNGIVNSKGIENAAINEKLNTDENFKRQAEALRSEGLDIPRAMKGEIVANYLYNNRDNLKDLVQEHPELKKDYEDLSNNFLTKYPETANAIVANKISQAREKLGYNSSVANFDTNTFEKHNDQIAKTLSPEEQKVWNNNKDDITKMIDTGGMLNRFEEGIEGGWSATKGLFNRVAQLNTHGQRISDEMIKQATAVTNNETGWKKALGTASNMMGTITYMMAGQGLGQGVGLNPATAEAATNVATFAEPMFREGEMKYPDNPFKATLSGMANTIAFASLSPLKSGKVSEALSFIKPEIDDAIKSLPENATVNTAKKRILTSVENGLKQYGTSVAEMGLVLPAVNQGMDMALGLDKRTFDKYHHDEFQNSLKTIAIGGVVPALIRMAAIPKAETPTIEEPPTVPISETTVPQSTQEEVQPTIQEKEQAPQQAVPVSSETQNILDRVNNADWINENDINNAENELYDLLDKNPNASHLIEPLILKLQNYEFTTKTETRTVTEKVPTGRTAKTKVEIKPALEQNIGEAVTVTNPKGQQSKGVLNLENGNYVVHDENGNKVAALGEKAINDRDLKLPSEEEMDNPIEFDNDGNVKSVTVKTRSGHLVRIDNPEKALDLAIQLMAQELGDVPDDAFNEVYDEVKKQIPVEVPKYPEKIGAEKGQKVTPQQKVLPQEEGGLDKKLKDNSENISANKEEPFTLFGKTFTDHAESELTAKDKETGLSDTPLTDKGEQQSKNLGEILAPTDVTTIEHNGVERTKQTAEQAAAEANKIRGIKEGTPMEEANGVKTVSNPLLSTLDTGKWTGKESGAFPEEEYFNNPDKVIEGTKDATTGKWMKQMEKLYQYVKDASKETHFIASSKVMRALKALDKTDGKWTNETTKDFLEQKEQPPEPPTKLPTEKVEVGKEEPKKVGVSHESLTNISNRLGLKQPERGEYLSPQWYAERGRKLLAEGADPNEVNNPNNELHDRISIARAHLENLVKEADKIAKDKGIDSEEYKKATQEVNDYANQTVKKLGTLAHRAFESLQGERDIDTDSFTNVKRATQETTGKPISKEQENKIRKLTDENQKLKQRAEEAEAKLIEATNKSIGKEKPKGKFETKARNVADKILKSELPIWLKIDDPSIKKQGLGAEEIKKLLADATIKVGQLLDKGVEFAEAVKEAIKDLVDVFGEDKRVEIEKGFIQHYKDLSKLSDAELKEQKFEEKQKAGLVRSKMERPLTEDEQIAKDQKELEELQTKFIDKKGNKFTPDESKSIWDYAKRNYLDKGVSYKDMISNVSNDLGLTWKQVSEAITSPKTKPISDAMWKRQAEYRRNQIATKNWIEEQGANPAVKLLKKVSGIFRGVSVFGHGGIFVGTHAGMTLFQPRTWNKTIPAFFRGWKFAYGNTANYERAMEQLKNDPNYILAQRAGLQNNPERINTEEYQKSQHFLGKLGLAGERGFNAIKVLRQQLFNYHWNKLSDAAKSDPKSAENISWLVNNATGATNLKLPSWVNEVSFAGGMEAARWGKLVRNPVRATSLALKALLVPDKVDVGDRVFAKVWASRVGEQIATFTGLLAANAAIQATVNPKNPVNLTNPNKSDFLKFKFGNETLDPTSGMRGAAMFAYTLGKIPFESQRQLKGDTRIQAAGKGAFGYGRGKLAPFYSTLADFYTSQDFNRNPMPYSMDKPTPGAHKLTWGEYAWSKTPLPIAEAANVFFKSAEDNSGNKPLLNAVLSGLVSGSTGFRVGEFKEKPSPITEQDKKDPTFKYFLDKGMSLPETSHAYTPILEGNQEKMLSEYDKKTQDEYDKTHKSYLKEYLQDFIDNGAYLKIIHTSTGDRYEVYNSDSNNIPEDAEFKDIKDLTKDQLRGVLSNAQKRATEQTKKDLFNQ